MTDHPWKLVAPWYRWPRQKQDEQRTPIQSRLVFQKFDAPDFVRGFVADPQHSLTFEEVDRVYRTHTTEAALKGGKFSKLLRMSTSATGSEKSLDTVLIPTPTRKLYLDTHKRYYLVVCELHCDAPGFPRVTPDQVCQAGFVVRRKSSAFPRGLPKEAAAHLQKIYKRQADVAYLEGTMPLRGRHATARDDRLKKLRVAGEYESHLVGLKNQLATEAAALAKWKDQFGAVPVSEGWIPSANKNVGSWQAVPENPTEVLESFFPLYRLFPNPKTPDHPAKHGTIYYGVVPTSSLDTDARGNARFDHTTNYEIKCFVRRHARDCPPTKAVPDCHGSLFWSDTTECFRLAAAADLIGTSQRPVTIHIPDLRELAAQAVGMKLNDFAPMKVVQPQGLDFEVDDQKAVKKGVNGFPQICFFAIPLITIVAFFVLRLFLPILVFLFNLYFLLAFRFCILPSVSIDADLDADLKLLPPSIHVDAGAAFTIEGLPFTPDDLGALLQGNVAADAGVTLTTDQRNELKQYANEPLLSLGKRAQAISAASVDGADAYGVQPAAGLHYEASVEWPA